jgi:hypothetical protein
MRPTPNSGRIASGAESGLADHFFDGEVSDIKLYSRALAPLEIAALTEERTLGAARSTAEPSLIAHWPLQERSGALISDVGPSRFVAKIVNGATLNLPGPSASTSIGRRGYDPDADPLRGGAIRFASDDLIDCGWASVASVTIPPDAASGTYCVSVRLAGSDEASLEMPFVVVRPKPRKKGTIALVYAVFTWAAYGRRPADDHVIPGLASTFYTRHANGTMHFNLGLRMPLPRVQPFVHRTHLMAATLHQHLVRPERLAESWLAHEGYAYACITDIDLEEDPSLLDDFAAVMIVGHSEYWSEGMYEAVDSYLRGGGNVACLSGNTALWRVSFNSDTRVVESRKTSHPGEGGAWLEPHEWGQRWHTDGQPGGKWAYVGQSPGELLGLESIGWIDSGEAGAFAPYTVVAADHYLFHDPEPVPIDGAGQLGARSHDGPAVSGYEMDGLPEQIGMPALPREGVTILGHAQHEHRFVAHWGSDPGYGADLLFWEKPTGGRVFHGGSINCTGALAVDPGMQALVRNVLHHFGVRRG